MGPVLTQQVKRWLEHSHEIAGALVPDSTGQFLQALDVHSGTRDAVVFPKAALQFHTHPSMCKKESDCYVDTPSPADVMGALKSADIYGTAAHVVFSHTGTYIMRMARMSDGGKQAVADQLHALFSSLSNQEQLPTFRGRWLHLMGKLGIKCTFAAHGQPLCLNVAIH